MDREKILSLAKELGISPEEMLKKIEKKRKDAGISHEEATEQVKEEHIVSDGTKFVEKRVGSRVIRRRKKPEEAKTKEEVKPEEPETKDAPEEIDEKPKEKEIRKLEEIEKAKEKLKEKLKEQIKKKRGRPKKVVVEDDKKEKEEKPKKEPKKLKTVPEAEPKIEPQVEIISKDKKVKEKEAKHKVEEDKKKKRKVKRFKTIFDKRKKLKDKDIEISGELDLSKETAVGEAGDMEGKKEKGKKKKSSTMPIVKESKRKIRLESEEITVGDFAKIINVKSGELIKKLMENGIMATINNSIDIDTAALMATEFGYEVEKITNVEDKIISEFDKTDKEEDLLPRPPIVTIMGHVDHGKTSLLDRIRKSNITSTEAGGITQHIGAYRVEVDNHIITFIDTPGHEAFTAMRARGAQVTDIVVLIVAADDGVMPQTIEAIQHAQAAEVPIIVAINKIDKDNANPEKVINQLMEYNLIPEDLGGDTLFVKVSAKTGKGVKDLLEAIIIQAEMLELKANPNKNAKGYVIESKLEKGRGTVATILVSEGTLKIGDFLVAGTHFCKVRAMIDYMGKRVKEATPSTPVEILGFSGVPDAGEMVFALKSEKEAKDLITHRINKSKEKEITQKQKISLEDLQKQILEGELKEVKLL
jgi:translation initiation factor IF-2